MALLRIRDIGYAPGTYPPGPSNSILDVPGVHVSQVTTPTSPNLPVGSNAAKGVTVITPRPPREFYKPCRAGTFTFNGNGEVTGSRQVEDWGFTNTPIALTNSLSLGSVFDGIWDWVLDQQDALGWDSMSRARHYGTPVVGETADWMINSDVRSSRVGKEDIAQCFAGLKDLEQGGSVQEGQFGGGAGMTCHMFAGGTGTSSRKVGGGEGSSGEYTVGVLVQTNYGHLKEMAIGGVPVGKMLMKEKSDAASSSEGVEMHASSDSRKDLAGRTEDGSIVVLIFTDAPLSTSQLQRVARHATVGLGQVGTYGIGANFSGDIFLALSTAEYGPEQLEGIKYRSPPPTQTYKSETVKNESITSYFQACAEAVEEAILNSIVGGRDGKVAMDGTVVDSFPVDRVRQILEQHLVKV